jgi:hypothetical protein
MDPWLLLISKVRRPVGMLGFQFQVRLECRFSSGEVKTVRAQGPGAAATPATKPADGHRINRCQRLFIQFTPTGPVRLRWWGE